MAAVSRASHASSSQLSAATLALSRAARASTLSGSAVRVAESSSVVVSSASICCSLGSIEPRSASNKASMLSPGTPSGCRSKRVSMKKGHADSTLGARVRRARSGGKGYTLRCRSARVGTRKTWFSPLAKRSRTPQRTSPASSPLGKCTTGKQSKCESSPSSSLRRYCPSSQVSKKPHSSPSKARLSCVCLPSNCASPASSGSLK